ncbi:MAG: hypothetical protein ACI9FB_003427 [Candidatus Azotimanducaceae bacterium]|jgi:hypothetical protein
MKIADGLIILFWLFLLSDAYFQGRELPILVSGVDIPELPMYLPIFAMLVIALMSSFVTFWQRKNIMEGPSIILSITDRFLGVGAYSQFTHRLRPVSASIATSLILAVVGLYTTFKTTQDTWSYIICIGFFVFAICMFSAYLVSKRFPPLLR